MRNERARPQQCCKSCTNGSNIVALRFSDYGTIEMLGVFGWKVWLVSNFAQQYATTCNRVSKRTQHVTSNKVGSCWSTMLRPFAHSLSHQKSKNPRNLARQHVLTKIVQAPMPMLISQWKPTPQLQEATADIGGGPQGAHGVVWQGCESYELNRMHPR